MDKECAKPRQTKYCRAIVKFVSECGHATNSMIAESLRQEFPDLSATTVHRATARLAERGKLTLAPPEPNGAMRYDANTEPHDHFMCSCCGRLRDMDVAGDVLDIVESKLDGCQISGRITITGVCKECKNKEKKDENYSI